MNKPRKILGSLLHFRIGSLAKDAIDQQLIISCNRTPHDTYLLQKFGEFIPIEYKPVAVGVILLQLLNKLG